MPTDREPSLVPYPTEPRVVTGAHRVRHCSGLVLVSKEHEQHTISLVLTDGQTVTIHLREKRRRIRREPPAGGA